MSPVRRVGLALAAGAAALGLVACQAGVNAQTSQEYSPVDGRNINAPAEPTRGEPYLALRGVIIVANDAGQGTLVATVRNKTDEPESLVGVTADDVAATIEGGALIIAPGASVTIGSEGGPTVSWPDLGSTAGSWTTLTLRFASAGNVTRDVLVTAQDGVFADVVIAGGA
jgi:hypothetical protein